MKNRFHREDLLPFVPKKATQILSRLAESGYQGWIVGGCVRDLLLARTPMDWDICTDATPEMVLSLFSHTVPTGLKHGTITVLMEKEPFEVTTLRIDGEYQDGRRPESVEFTTDIEKDLSRRDFTINSMALDQNGILYDPFQGQEDLDRKLIRCVGEADVRFTEDGLRMLRALRFHAQLGFDIEEKAGAAIRANHNKLAAVSAERICVELDKILLSENPSAIFELEAYHLLSDLIPELVPSIYTFQRNPYHEQTVAVHTQKALREIPSNKTLRWAILLHDIGKPNCHSIDSEGVSHFYGHEKESVRLSLQIMERLKFSREDSETIQTLIALHDYQIEETERSVRRALNKIGEALFPAFLEIKKADTKGQHSNYIKDRLEKLAHIEEIAKDVIEKQHCFSLKDLKINGNDLLSLGIKPGKDIGSLLQLLLDQVLEEPSLNQKEVLLSIIRENYLKKLL